MAYFQSSQSGLNNIKWIFLHSAQGEEMGWGWKENGAVCTYINLWFRLIFK